MSLVSKSGLKTILAAGMLAAFIAPANATLVVTMAGGGGGDNVLSNNSCTSPTGAPATSILGCLNSNGNTKVQFDSTANTTQENMDFAAGGQAKLIAAGPGIDLTEDSKDWGFNNVTISLGGGLVFSQIILNIEVFDATNINFFSNLGETSGPYALSGKGNGDFTISSDLGDLTWLRIESGDRTFSYDVTTGSGKDKVKTTHTVTDGDINDIKQVRFSGVKTPEPPCTGNCCTSNCCSGAECCDSDCCGNDCGGPGPSVPEPASLFLLGSALLGYGASRKKKSA